MQIVDHQVERLLESVQLEQELLDHHRACEDAAPG